MQPKSEFGNLEFDKYDLKCFFEHLRRQLISINVVSEPTFMTLPYSEVDETTLSQSRIFSVTDQTSLTQSRANRRTDESTASQRKIHGNIFWSILLSKSCQNLLICQKADMFWLELI